MSREELIKSVCSIISKQAKIWGTWGAVFAAHLHPNLEYVFPLVAMLVGTQFAEEKIKMQLLPFADDICKEYCKNN